MSQKYGRFFHLGLIGYPLEHSFSPRLHNAALKSAGLRGDYRLFPIPPGEAGHAEMKVLFDHLRREDLHGINVTIPHKQTVMGLVDDLSEVSRAVGAVNTLSVSRDGRLIGDNTDVPGFLRDLHQRIDGMNGGRALVFGAGGSARAVVYGLGMSGWEVTVLARREEQAVGLVRDLGNVLIGKQKMTSGVLSEKSLSNHPKYDLLVNTTPSGMYPHVHGCPWPEDITLSGVGAVYDLVYNPLETVLVHRARAAGLPAANGAGMLIAQAALSFQCWTGTEAPFEVMEHAFFVPQSL